jgi:hypothetical protein
MSDLEDKSQHEEIKEEIKEEVKVDDHIEEEVEETLTTEEQQKIQTIQQEIFAPTPVEKKEPPKPFSIWSIFSFNFNPSDLVTAINNKQTQVVRPFNIQNSLHLDKSVTINNISGKNAYVILTPAPIKTLGSFGFGAGFSGIDASVDASLETKGEYKAQKLSISNNTSSRYELDNTKFYCTLFLHIDGEWKKSWDNRRFNGRKFDINILEKHVQAALDKDNIPDF